MKPMWKNLRVKALLVGCVGLTTGCARDRIVVQGANMPRGGGPSDVSSTVALSATQPTATPRDGKPTTFDLPSAIPGSEAPAVRAPRFGNDATPAERDEAIRKLYPEVTPVALAVPATTEPGPRSLGDWQQIAMANSPKIRQSQADADASYGQVIQAGLHPNPTVGYQVDQWQPSLKIPPGNTGSGAGQQGGFINQLIKTAGKLSLTQQVAGFDYINALVAVRKAQVDVTAQVRAAYFSALVARQSLEVYTAVATLADEVYKLQLKRVAAGVATGYEPFQFHAQAVQARNAVALAEATYKAAVKQLAAAAGQPDLATAPLAGRADIAAPILDVDVVKARLLDQHTDLLTARNQIAQAQTNLLLQRRLPIPDLQTNTYQQYDNLAQTYQFGVQLGIQIPVSDRNQGNIRTARSKIVSAGEALRTTENDLLGRLAEAFGRYEANVKVARTYREQILPDLTQVYRGVVRQYQVEPDKVGFNDIVVSQLNLVQSLQAYQSALDAQWKAVVDMAALGQLDELYPAN